MQNLFSQNGSFVPIAGHAFYLVLTPILVVSVTDLIIPVDESAVLEMYRDSGANYGLTVEVVKSNEAAKDARGLLFATWVAGVLVDSREIRQAGAWGGLGAHAAAGNYKMRLIMWDADSAQAVWSVDTKSFSNDVPQEDARSLAEFVAQQLRSDGFVD